MCTIKSTYGLSGLQKGDEHPIYTPKEYGTTLPFTVPQECSGKP